jgi:hypothetical protein
MSIMIMSIIPVISLLYNKKSIDNVMRALGFNSYNTIQMETSILFQFGIKVCEKKRNSNN